MSLRNVLLSNVIEIENSYLDNVGKYEVSKWHSGKKVRNELKISILYFKEN